VVAGADTLRPASGFSQALWWISRTRGARANTYARPPCHLRVRARHSSNGGLDVGRASSGFGEPPFRGRAAPQKLALRRTRSASRRVLFDFQSTSEGCGIGAIAIAHPFLREQEPLARLVQVLRQPNEIGPGRGPRRVGHERLRAMDSESHFSRSGSHVQALARSATRGSATTRVPCSGEKVIARRTIRAGGVCARLSFIAARTVAVTIFIS